MPKEFKLPELGENISSGNVSKVLVRVGDTISVDQPVLEMETDKAVIEVPSSVAGTVTAVNVQEGKSVNVGAVILVVGDGDGKAAAAASAPPTPAPTVAVKPAAPPAPKPVPPVQTAPPAPAAAPTTAEPVAVVAAPAAEAPLRAELPHPPRANAGAVPAAPSVRRLAREIGVDITQVGGTGPGGRITMDDVKAFARQVNTDVRGVTVHQAGVAVQEALPDFSRWGEIEHRAMTSVRRRTAEHMAYSWSTIPHVTQFDKVDITELERLRKKHMQRVERMGGKLTVTGMILKVIAAALKQFPQFNASLDAPNNEIIYKKYYNIGVAVDTDRGLLVPVLHNVDQKNIIQLSIELTQAAERARNRKTTLDEMQGGTFTVTNLGGIGGTAFTPIVNAPEVAILGISRTQIEPVFIDGKFEPRTVLPLALSYDHRVIDGADGARFLRWIIEVIEQPFLLFLEA
ncbi:MAG: 2-oxo acid dehydrogenase subunit E2 [Candidatus Hydrogenedentes bacterium]|nr:2-oxo acid dehydrogenase subunit E2 [Candidatus Hydrogenedentota bacterium]